MNISGISTGNYKKNIQFEGYSQNFTDVQYARDAYRHLKNPELVKNWGLTIDIVKANIKYELARFKTLREMFENDPMVDLKVKRTFGNSTDEVDTVFVDSYEMFTKPNEAFCEKHGNKSLSNICETGVSLHHPGVCSHENETLIPRLEKEAKYLRKRIAQEFSLEG